MFQMHGIIEVFTEMSMSIMRHNVAFAHIRIRMGVIPSGSLFIMSSHQSFEVSFVSQS